MIPWQLIVDEWEFPIAILSKNNDRLMLSVSVSEAPKAAAAESEADKQRRLHRERWDLRDMSRYTGPSDTDWTQSPEWILSHREYDFDPPERPRYYPDQTRPDYYWSEPEVDAPDKWENWARALAV